MAVSGTPTSGDDTLVGDNADDVIAGEEGNDVIDGGGGADIIYGDVTYLTNGGLDSDQPDNSWSPGAVDGWFNPGSNGTIERWGDGFLGLPTDDGGTFIELDGNRAGIDHVQTNVELDTGVTYTLSFDHAARAGSSVNDDFQVTHNGVVIATISPSSTTTFTTTTLTITGVSGTDTIGFRELPSQDNSLGPLLDNVQITLTEASAAASAFSFDDTLNGGAGDDRIYGQEGDDVITGGTGNDYIEGGIGDDTIALTDGGGTDIVGDFTIGEDLLDVSGLTDANGNPIGLKDVVVTSDGQGGSILTFPNGEQVILRDVPPSDLDTKPELRAVGIPCLAGGTKVATAAGLKPIEELQQGDLVEVCPCSDSKGPSHAVLRRVFSRTVGVDELRQRPEFRPVRISKGALGRGLPVNDLLVSRQHRMVVDSAIATRMFGSAEVLVPAIKLTRLPGISVEQEVESVTYYHLLFDEHQVIFAEGAPTESLYTGPQALKALAPEARAEIFGLFPEIRRPDHVPMPARPIPPAKRQKRLIERHLKNGKPLIRTGDTANQARFARTAQIA
ncbi:MAG: Hint domain-containing protein [Ruegeria sp.]|uniref:Hint domain-containing protein n=1 Tax=Ruegeria sp. TaxID=1879320 RepID=UPI00349EC155